MSDRVPHSELLPVIPHTRLVSLLNSPSVFSTSADEYLRRLLDQIPMVGVLVVTEDACIVYANRTAHRILGYPFPGELVGTQLDMLVPSELRTQHHGHRAHFFKQPSERVMGPNLDLEAVRKDGRRIKVLIGLAPDRMAETNVAVVSLAERQ